MRDDGDLVIWLQSVSDEDQVITCPIVRGEILFGINRLPQGRRREHLEAKAHALLSALPCHAIPPEAGELYASVKLAQQRRGLPLDENDLWVAATALALGATLVTRDVAFARVDNLPLISP